MAINEVQICKAHLNETMQSATDGVNGVVYQGHLNRLKAHNMDESLKSGMGMVTNFNCVCQSETMKILFFIQLKLNITSAFT